MSTCPENDIHSLYIDNELPSAYIAEYEEHIASCASCRQKLDRAKSLHALLCADAKDLTLSAEQIDKSFERLQTKLSYSKTVSASKSSSHVLKLRNSAGVVGAIAGAAAAALVLLVVPSKNSSSEIASATQSASSQPALGARIQIQSPDELALTSMATSLLTGLSQNAGTSPQEIVITPRITPVASSNDFIFVDQTDGLSASQAVKASLASYDVITPSVQVLNQTQTNSGFTFKITTQQATISFEIGNEN